MPESWSNRFLSLLMPWFMYRIQWQRAWPWDFVSSMPVLSQLQLVSEFSCTCSPYMFSVAVLSLQKTLILPSDSSSALNADSSLCNTSRENNLNAGVFFWHLPILFNKICSELLPEIQNMLWEWKQPMSEFGDFFFCSCIYCFLDLTNAFSLKEKNTSIIIFHQSLPILPLPCLPPGKEN